MLQILTPVLVYESCELNGTVYRDFDFHVPCPTLKTGIQ